jgi:hypothetical protein
MYDGDGDGDDDRDDADDGVIPHLKCDVEMEFEGPNDATMNKWAADVLRRLADSIERNEFYGQDGHHPLLDNVGKKVGEVYIAYDGELGV